MSTTSTSGKRRPQRHTARPPAQPIEIRVSPGPIPPEPPPTVDILELHERVTNLERMAITASQEHQEAILALERAERHAATTWTKAREMRRQLEVETGKLPSV